MSQSYIDGKEILITGGSGSLSKALIDLLMTKHKPKGIRLLSRGELGQWKLRKELSQKYPNANIEYIIADVRDLQRLTLASRGVQVLVHAGALKHINVGEDDPIEVVNTNIFGSQNILYAALENKIEKVLGVSTDKACNPVNLYGSSKLCMEKLLIRGNVYSGDGSTRLSCVRYGNVIGSNGSVVPLFLDQYKKNGEITVTHKDMTRFWITLPKVAKFIVDSIQDMTGGEIFVPFMPSSTVLEIADVVAPKAKKVYTGIRPGEKLHEILISKEESRKTIFDEENNRYIITDKEQGHEFEFTSYNNAQWLTKQEIKDMIP